MDPGCVLLWQLCPDRQETARTARSGEQRSIAASSHTPGTLQLDDLQLGRELDEQAEIPAAERSSSLVLAVLHPQACCMLLPLCGTQITSYDRSLMFDGLKLGFAPQSCHVSMFLQAGPTRWLESEIR